MEVSLNTIKRYYETLILYCCLFPYVSFSLNSLDSQPWTLLLVSIYFLYNLKFEERNIFILWLLSVFTIIFSLIYSNELHLNHLVRSISNYTVVFFVWTFSIIIHKIQPSETLYNC